MNIYFIAAIAIYLAVFIYCIRRGMSKGAVNELRTMLTVICAALSFELAASVIKSRATGEAASMFIGTILLIIVAAAYSIFHTLFGAIHVLSRLPLVRVVDNILGIVFGAVTAAVTLYIADALLRYFVLV